MNYLQDAIKFNSLYRISKYIWLYHILYRPNYRSIGELLNIV